LNNEHPFIIDLLKMDDWCLVIFTNGERINGIW